MTNTITLVVIISAVVIWAAWDVWVVFFAKKTSISISKYIRYASSRVSVVPYSCGVLCGHWFWPYAPAPSGLTTIYVLSISALALAGGHAYLRHRLQTTPPWLSIIYCLSGLFVGHYYWPMGV